MSFFQNFNAELFKLKFSSACIFFYLLINYQQCRTSLPSDLGVQCLNLSFDELKCFNAKFIKKILLNLIIASFQMSHFRYFASCKILFK